MSKVKIRVLLSNLKRILFRIIFRHEKLNNCKLYATILVKNEEDILEKNIIFHKAMGVDGFIVTNNNSTDSTGAILNKYYEKGWIKKIINEPSEEYSQAKWVNRMINIAKEKYNADWIINIDADEFWYSNKYNLKLDLQNTNANVIKCDMKNIVPLNDEVFYNNTLMIKNHIKNMEGYNLSKFNIYGEQFPKVIHRTQNYKMISIGNHNVSMKYKSEIHSKDVTIFHFAIRSRQHFKNKMINGGEAIEKNLKAGKEIANHWRYFYNGWKDGSLDLDKEYDKTIGLEYLAEFKSKGIIEENSSLKKYIDKLLKNGR